MQEVDNILRILKESREAISKNDSFQLKNLSQQTIHTATISQDPDNIIVSVLVYSIGKIIGKEGFKEMEGWDFFYKTLQENLDKSINALENNRIEEFRTAIGKIRNSINKISGSLSEYIKDIFYKAGINKAFKIYEHGLSSEKTAELLGVSLWDLAGYIGQSTITESHLNETIPIKTRIKTTEDFFRK